MIYNQLKMNAEEVVKLCKLFQKNKIKIWIDGGWGIDALLSKQTRPHNDLDIAVRHKNVSKITRLLQAEGYQEIKDPNKKDYNFVLRNGRGYKIDIHSFEFDKMGNNIYGINYPKQSLTGKGIISGQIINCIAPEYVVQFHGNYEPKKKDLQDLKALCKKFNLELPENYKNRI